ncbi:hypothetical protein [Aurantiacibacter flavus]|uniref:Uncharacterized protein n=1 Tax=Aurantiacibacter flavus TaxID=3145232 RepID=A0ABV0CZ47_9SPHN
MSIKFAFLSASLATLAAASSAQAHDDRYGTPSEPIEYESYEVVQDIGDEPAYDDVYEEAYEYETYVDPAPGHHAMRALPARHAHYPTMTPETVVMSGPIGQPLGYTPEQRADWLSDCHTVYLREYSEIYNSGDDDYRFAADQADRYCDAYLAGFDRGEVSAYRTGTYPLGAYPVMMVPVQTTRRYAPREIVHEEWVDVDATPRHARRSIPRRAAPQPDKRTPIR